MGAKEDYQKETEDQLKELKSKGAKTRINLEEIMEMQNNTEG